MKSLYLIGYHGCGKTTQADLIKSNHPDLIYPGGRSGLDAVGSVSKLIEILRMAQNDIVLHGCIYQSKKTLSRLSSMTRLTVAVLMTSPQTVRDRSIQRGAKSWNPDRYDHHYKFIKKLPQLRRELMFGLRFIDNDRAATEVSGDILKIVSELKME